jgi:hypothetical protein
LIRGREVSSAIPHRMKTGDDIEPKTDAQFRSNKKLVVGFQGTASNDCVG